MAMLWLLLWRLLSQQQLLGLCIAGSFWNHFVVFQEQDKYHEGQQYLSEHVICVADGVAAAAAAILLHSVATDTSNTWPTLKM